MSEIKQVKIIDKSDKCYGMVGDVFDVEQSRLSGHDRYYIQIKGYDNCIKAGYTPEDIKKKRLDEIGFHRIVDADKCEVVDTEQTANLGMKKEVSTRKVVFTGQCIARYKYSSVAEVPSFVPPYGESDYIKELIQAGDFSKIDIITDVRKTLDFKSADKYFIHYVGSPAYKNSIDIKRLFDTEIAIITHNEQEYGELEEILRQEYGQIFRQCDTLNTNTNVYFYYWCSNIITVTNEPPVVQKLLDYRECDFVKNRDKWEQDYKKEIEEYENTHPVEDLSIDDDLRRMPRQELMELVQSLRRELANAQEDIEYLNDTIDNIHEQEMDELCEE